MTKIIYVKEENGAGDQLLDTCTIDKEWGYLYSAHDKEAEKARQHGHQLVPLGDDQKAVIKKGRPQ